MARRKKGEPETLSYDETELITWFERDRAHVELRSSKSDETIVEWWDEEVTEAVEDGFLSHRRGLHQSAYEYAVERGLILEPDDDEDEDDEEEDDE